jgi:hypothetical protein
LLWLRIQVLYRTKVEWVDTIVSFMTLKEMLSVFSLQYSVSCKFIIYSSFYVKVQYIPSIHSIFKDFIMKDYLVWSKTIKKERLMIMWFCLLFCLCAVLFIDLHVLKYTFTKTIWSKGMIFFDVWLNLVCNFIEKLWVCVHQRKWSIIFLSYYYWFVALSWYWILRMSQ